MASVISCWKLPSCLAEPIPGSENGCAAGKAGPIRDSGITSVVTVFRRNQNKSRDAVLISATTE